MPVIAPVVSKRPGQEHPITPTGIPLTVPDETLRAFLDEDLGKPWRDITSDPLFADERGAARVIAREACVVSGVEETVRLFALAGAQATAIVADGDTCAEGSVLVAVTGPVRAILRAERTVLNLMGRMSGIATLTRRVQDDVDAVRPGVLVAATRKTTPGFRVFEKRAVFHGGGDPHRSGLWDQVLVKDNHRAAGGDLAAMIRRLRVANPDAILEVEVESEDEARVAAEAGVDIVLVDNHTPEGLARIAVLVRSVSSRVLIEASGGITPANAPLYAPYADRISLGALTKGAHSADLSLEWNA